jgi:hypothetical protein
MLIFTDRDETTHYILKKKCRLLDAFVMVLQLLEKTVHKIVKENSNTENEVGKKINEFYWVVIGRVGTHSISSCLVSERGT